MPAYNRVIIAGHLTRDVETRYTPKGTAVARLGIAVNRQWKTDSGEEKQEVTFIDVDAFGKQAEVLAQYVKKGHPLLIEGRLKYESWEDKQTNQKRSKLMVVLESFQFLTSKGEGEPTPAATAKAPATKPSAGGPPPDDGDEIPFAPDPIM